MSTKADFEAMTLEALEEAWKLSDSRRQAARLKRRLSKGLVAARSTARS